MTSSLLSLIQAPALPYFLKKRQKSLSAKQGNIYNSLPSFESMVKRYSKNLEKENILLSDERTLLSNERTFLAYINIALTSLLLGLALLQIAQLPQFPSNLAYIGIFAIFVAIITLITGFILYIQRKKEILSIERIKIT
ncbi:DUF202 domain-containing protein [Candidatus Pacearchaeota archaeon]|nr:DUF202 domain-containing protein [Candidatus Pacearchaeota archaeon]